MIYFKKNGIFYENDYKPDYEDYVYKKVDSVIPYLDNIIKFDSNLTLKDFFMLFEGDEDMVEIVFGSQLGHFPIRPYIDEVKKECIPEDRENMDYIECSWVAEQFDYRLIYEKHKNDENTVYSRLGGGIHEPDKDDENEFSLDVDVSGYGPYVLDKNDGYKEGDILPTHTSYGIEFTPLQKMAHLPIKLNLSIRIRDINEMGNEKPLVEAIKYFTVFEVVGALLSEMSFRGLPEERDIEWQDILDDVKYIKEKLAKEKEEDEEEDE